ncbi:unnamed protein product [Haemonchus placei]|uniref:SCP domain-containing protein n=1 Tax=Haemonchus placei TaxID=6290 RepID=A0A0N4WX68_HAEPC|nr:unnamed protein product [Haemonchus placei]
MMKNNLYTHLQVVHKKFVEELMEIREQINREAGLAKVICPLFYESYTNYDEQAQHCRANHSEDDAGGRPQNYSAISMNFASREEYQVCECGNHLTEKLIYCVSYGLREFARKIVHRSPKCTQKPWLPQPGKGYCEFLAANYAENKAFPITCLESGATVLVCTHQLQHGELV